MAMATLMELECKYGVVRVDVLEVFFCYGVKVGASCLPIILPA